MNPESAYTPPHRGEFPLVAAVTSEEITALLDSVQNYRVDLSESSEFFRVVDILLHRVPGYEQLFEGLMKSFGTSLPGHQSAEVLLHTLLQKAEGSSYQYWSRKVEQLPLDEALYPTRASNVEIVLSNARAERNERPSFSRLLVLMERADALSIATYLDSVFLDWQRAIQDEDLDYIQSSAGLFLSPILEIINTNSQTERVESRLAYSAGVDFFKKYFKYADQYPRLAEIFVREVEIACTKEQHKITEFLGGIRYLRTGLGSELDVRMQLGVALVLESGDQVHEIIRVALLRAVEYQKPSV